LALGREYSKYLKHFLGRGNQEDFIFDVGAGFENPSLYNAFTKAKHLLFEPLPKHVDYFKIDYCRSNFKVYQTGLACEEGLRKLYIQITRIGSSFLEPTKKPQDVAQVSGVCLEGEWIDVPIQKLQKLNDLFELSLIPVKNLLIITFGFLLYKNL
jgi:hypothetical protein